MRAWIRGLGLSGMALTVLALPLQSHCTSRLTGMTQSDFLALLTRPMEERVAEIRTLADFHSRLSRTAFDKGLGLQIRWRSITTMGRIDALGFRKDLERALGSHEWFMRNAALVALQTDTRDHAVRWSARLIEDPALLVRTQAIRNLIHFDARETESLLWREIFSPRNFQHDESLWVREYLAEALARFARAGRTKLFERLLMDNDPRLHRWAVLGLERTTGFRVGDPSAPIEIRRQEWLERLLGNQTI